MAAGRIDLPAVGGGGDQHRAGRGTGLAERHEEGPHRGRAARNLEAEERVGEALVVGRRMLDLHLGQFDVELFGDQHRHRGVSALAHLDLRDRQRDAPVAGDPHEGVRREGGAGRCGGRQMPADHQASPERRTGLEERAASHVRVEPGCDPRHDRPPFVPSDPAACLIASRMRT